MIEKNIQNETIFKLIGVSFALISLRGYKDIPQTPSSAPYMPNFPSNPSTPETAPYPTTTPDTAPINSIAVSTG